MKYTERQIYSVFIRVVYFYLFYRSIYDVEAIHRYSHIVYFFFHNICDSSVSYSYIVYSYN